MNLINKIKKLINTNDQCNQIQLARYVIASYSEFFYNYSFNCERLCFSQISDEIKNEINQSYKSENGQEILHLGVLYESILPKELKKKLGQVFTPQETIKQMIDTTLLEEDYLKNPHLRILDPSCGAGDFLVLLYHKILQIITKNAKYFEENHNLHQGNLSQHILLNNLFGFEIDYFTKEMCLANIAISCHSTLSPNILIEDFLFYDNESCFDIIIGNPPYIGHKNLIIDHKKALKSWFSVYNDKADISYCFFEKSYQCLFPRGKLSLITSRYFLEANFADKLRAFITKHYQIEEIVDFSGTVHFKNTGISPLMIRLIKTESLGNIQVTDISKNHQYIVKQVTLSSKPWKLIPEKAMKTYEKIMNQARLTIKDTFIMKQGIITGLDSAFIVDEETIDRYSLEKEILVNWIKGASVQKEGIIDKKKLKLIYTNDIELSQYPKVANYLDQYKNRLSVRRECIKGYRRWYDLQWSRNKSLFTNDKILFPYKASNNRFVLDSQGYFFSADVYMMKPINNSISSDEAIYYLNSVIFEFLIKVTSKKIGINHYEYYPYNLQNLPYFNFSFNNEIFNQDSNKNNLQFNDLLAYYLNLDDEDMETIRNQINR
ncbi:MAG: N-6 DNA methylase [Tissierellales bacterium]|nr:N-6 DNA methylase [Tissierellales bacterium]